MEQIIKNLSQLKNIVPELLKAAGSRKKWCFYGEVGAGKTTLIKEIVAYLGVQEAVTSPTYSLINEYEYQDKGSQKACLLFHMDLYRLKTIEEALDIGIEDHIESADYCFMEWPELIENLLPEDSFKISLEIVKDSERKIVYL